MVRSFPRITRRPVTTVAAAVVAASLLCGLGATPSASADQDKGKSKASQRAQDLKEKKSAELKRDRKRLERQAGEAHEELEHSSDALQQATARLGAANAELDKAQAHLAHTRGELAAAEALDRQMQAKLDEAIARLEQAQADLDAGHVKIAEQERELGQIIVANYQTGDPALMGLSMVLTSQDPTELTGQLNSVQNVIDKEDATLSRLEASKVLLAVQEQLVAEARDEVARQRRAAAENLVKKQDLEKQAAAQELQVQNLVSLRSEAEEEAEKARQADLATLQSLEKEEKRITAILKKRAKAAERRARRAAAAANQAFGPVSSNGYLDYPVGGEVTSPYGWRRHPIYGYTALHDGIDFGSACGTPILAPAAGRVLQEYFQSAWGNRIIIDHGFHKGAGLATIANHLSGYAVSEGEWVERGQVIGYVGTTGWSTGCHLHFTVMENGSPVNPMQWL